MTCHYCGELMGPGEALRVLPLDWRLGPFAIHRPNIRGSCLRAAGRADQTAIELYDRAAAAEHDRRYDSAGVRANDVQQKLDDALLKNQRSMELAYG